MDAASSRRGRGDLLGRIGVPPDLVPILNQAGPFWSKNDFDKVFEWISDENGQAFGAMLVLVRRRLRLTPGQVGIGSVSKDALDHALDHEATHSLLGFLEQLPVVLHGFDPTQSAFFPHLCGCLHSFLEVGLPPDVQTILLKAERTFDEINVVAEWVFKSWGARLRCLAELHLGASATASDVQEAVQAFFESRPRKSWPGQGIAATGSSAAVKAEAVKIVRNFNATRGHLWPYLRKCFVRFCWKREKKIKSVHEHEEPIPTGAGSEGEEIEIEFEDPSAILGAARMEGEEMRRVVQKCLRRLNQKASSVIDCLFFKGFTVKQTAMALDLSEANVKVLKFRAIPDLRQMPELREYINGSY